MKLAELQKKFIRSIYGNDSSIKDCFQATYPELSMYIYRNNLYTNLKLALANTYPSVKILVGEEKFEVLCREYIKNNVSRSGNLDDYGTTFPEFLRVKDMDNIHEISRLDLAVHMAYIAPNYQLRTIEEFRNINPMHYENLRFILNPSIKELCLKYDVLPLWEKINNNQYYQENYNLPKYRNYVLIYRNMKFQICSLAISKKEYEFIRMIRENKRFYQVFKKLDGKCKEEEFKTILNKFIVHHILIDFII